MAKSPNEENFRGTWGPSCVEHPASSNTSKEAHCADPARGNSSDSHVDHFSESPPRYNAQGTCFAMATKLFQAGGMRNKLKTDSMFSESISRMSPPSRTTSQRQKTRSHPKDDESKYSWAPFEMERCSSTGEPSRTRFNSGAPIAPLRSNLQ